MDTAKIKAIIAVVIALFGALYLGIAAATAQFEAIAWVVGGSTFIICLLLGRKIWLLIPLFGALNLSLSIPSRPDTLLLAQLLVIGFSGMLLLLRKLPFRLAITELEIWMFLIAALIIQVYVRNPTGFSIFGGSSVGGKPYVIFVVTTVSAFLLAGLRVSESEIRTALRLTIAGGLLNFATSLLGRAFPVVGYWTGTNFGGVMNQESTGEAVDSRQATRAGFLMTAGTNLSWWISAFRSPFRACFHPIWAPIILLSFAFAALSGFRSAIGLIGLTYLVGIFYRGGIIQVVISAMLGVMALALLALVNLTAPLPPNIQRSLSFLPGTWEDRYLRDTQGSTDWRVEMWQEALGSDRWIQNKLLGDGLGFTMREYQYQQSLQDGQLTGMGISGFDADREGALASGNYHSVFISSVRTVGYIGFVVYLFAAIRTALHAHRLIRRYRFTPHYSTCLFFGLPAIVSLLWLPFSAITFLQVASATLGAIAMLRILQNNLPKIEQTADTAPPDHVIHPLTPRRQLQPS